MSAYVPSERLLAKVAAYEQAQKAADAAREELRDAVADELRDTGTSSDQIAKHVPWTTKTVRSIAHDNGIPMKRKPTVQSINTRRHKSGGQSSG